MGCLPLLHAFCCEPHKMYRYYKDRKARKLKKQVGDSSDSSDNARIVSEKTSRGQQRGDLRDHREHRDHRRRRSPSDTPADKRRKSPKTSSESHNTGTVASPRIVLTPPPRKRSLPPWPAPAVEIQQRYQTPPPPPAIPHAPNPTEPVPGPAPEPELEPSFAHTTLVVEPADPALPLVSAVAPALQIRHRPATAPPALVTHVSASIPRAPPQGQWPATVLEEGIFSPSQSTLQTQQTPVVTYQEAPSRGSVITPPEVFQYLMPESTIGPTDDDKRSNAAAADTSESTGLELVQDSHIIAEEPVYGQPTASTLSPQIDVEIYATPSGRRRERSVSRVRSEKNSRHRSKSRPDSSYSTNHREFRDSHHELRDSMFFLDGPRGDESDSSSMPAFSPLPTPDREQSVYIDQTRPRPDQLQARGHGSQPRSNPPLTRLIMGPMPKQSGIEIHRSQVDPNYDFASNLESLAREALREQAVWPTRRCSRRDRKEREDSERENSERENSSGRSDGERPRRSVSKGPPSTSVTRPTSSRRPKMPRRSSGNSRPGSYGSNQIHQITLPDSPRYTSVDIQIDLKKYQPKVLAKPGFSYEEVGPLLRTKQEYLDHLSSHIANKGLEAFQTSDSPDPLEIARLAEAEADRICASLGISNYATPDLTKVALYNVIVFCDDSGSMLADNRFDDQKSIVQRISKIAQTYNSSGISIRFINFEKDDAYNNLSHGEIDSTFASVSPDGTTRLGTKLLEKVVIPFVIEPARKMELKKPVLISIITDGEPTEENLNTLKWGILACKNELKKFVTAAGLPYGRSAVTFQINRVGNSPESKSFLERLANDPEVGEMIFCNDETLNAALAEAGPDSGALNTWLTQLLAGAVSN